jgi:oligoendopeptidase F
MLGRAAHLPQSAADGAQLVGPALDNLTLSYKTLDNQVTAAPATDGTQADAAATQFAARWNPFIANEARFAALLIPIIDLHQGEAKAQGFTDAPAAAYFDDHLTTSEVDRALAAVRKSDGYERYIAVLASIASQRLQVAPAALHAWDLDRIDRYTPPRVPLPAALRLILAAEKPMGAEYASQFARLFDPSSGRLEWCRSATCDKAGFSVGYAGLVSGLFYGSYTGDVDSMRAVAHEAGHAVHRELMAENQPLAVYNDGPKFMFESFAIFNELLFLDHLYQTADSPAARAYYLNRFLADATFQVWGSAKETDLEQSLYAAAAGGKLHDAADLDALTLRVFRRYMPQPTLDPRMRVYWARDRLYFTDPVYDANYLFAGLLALEYLRRLHEEPAVFPTRYAALLKNGFTDSPRALERKFLGIDLEDTDGLVRDAAALIERRAVVLRSLYGAAKVSATGTHRGACGTRVASARTGA